jgi:hypothetical protein
MQVRFLQSVAGLTWSYFAGQVAEVDERQAAAWLAGGVCERADPEQVELAVGAPQRKRR